MKKLLPSLVLLILIGCEERDTCRAIDVKVSLATHQASLKIGDTLKISAIMSCTSEGKIALKSDAASNFAFELFSGAHRVSSTKIQNGGDFKLYGSGTVLQLIVPISIEGQTPMLIFSPSEKMRIRQGENRMRVSYMPPSKSLDWADSDEEHPFAEITFGVADK